MLNCYTQTANINLTWLTFKQLKSPKEKQLLDYLVQVCPSADFSIRGTCLLNGFSSVVKCLIMCSDSKKVLGSIVCSCHACAGFFRALWSPLKLKHVHMGNHSPVFALDHNNKKHSFNFTALYSRLKKKKEKDLLLLL